MAAPTCPDCGRLTGTNGAERFHLCDGPKVLYPPAFRGPEAPAAAPADDLVHYPSGATRSRDADLYRFDLISAKAMHRLAATYAEGSAKHGEHNWRGGTPFSVALNHVLRHLFLWSDRDGDVDGEPLTEDHLAHAAWGLFALMEYEATHPELDDRHRP